MDNQPISDVEVSLTKELDESVYTDYRRKKFLEKLQAFLRKRKTLLLIIGAVLLVATAVALFLNRNTISERNLIGAWVPDIIGTTFQIEFDQGASFVERFPNPEIPDRYGYWELIDGQLRITIRQEPVEIMTFDAVLRHGILTLNPTHGSTRLTELSTEFRKAP